MLPFKDDVTAVLDFVVTAMSGIAVFSAKIIFNVVVIFIVGTLVEDRDGATNVGPTLFDDGESKE